MQKAKKSGFLILGFIIVIFVIIAIIFILKDKAKDLTLSMYKQISNNQKFTLTMEEKGEDYNYKVSIARSDTDISIDTNTEFSDEKQHNTTLITDGYIYYITHDEQEYMALDIQDVEIDSVIPEIKDVDGKEYQKGKEEIKGKTYYYEEYE
ncbi:MAG: hypothetical protein HFJ17_03570, partial [Clostridia bacterium]|nr:hypothetical protein [Clostridia bacterium]